MRLQAPLGAVCERCGDSGEPGMNLLVHLAVKTARVLTQGGTGAEFARRRSKKKARSCDACRRVWQPLLNSKHLALIPAKSQARQASFAATCTLASASLPHSAPRTVVG